MGITISEPVVDKNIEKAEDDRFTVGSCAMQGWRMTMEDSHTVLLQLPGDPKGTFFGVYDGHGGSKVSEVASIGLHKHIVDNPNYAKGDYILALKQAFLSFDKDVRDNYSASLAGTTAICFLIVNKKVYCANVGDSRGVACVNGQCVQLSQDHKPDNEPELRRIISAGGYVQGSRVNGSLALSRAFGDFQYKENTNLPPELQIVSCMPDIETIDLNDDLNFLVLACDGIWDVMTSRSVVEFVISRLEGRMRPEVICEQLTMRCLADDYERLIGCDNMTVILICYTRGMNYDDYCATVWQKWMDSLPTNAKLLHEYAAENPEILSGVDLEEFLAYIRNKPENNNCHVAGVSTTESSNSTHDDKQPQTSSNKEVNVCQETFKQLNIIDNNETKSTNNNEIEEGNSNTMNTKEIHEKSEDTIVPERDKLNLSEQDKCTTTTTTTTMDGISADKPKQISSSSTDDVTTTIPLKLKQPQCSNSNSNSNNKTSPERLTSS